MGIYKTANDIVSSIESILEEFGLERSKILSITTDNGSNVKLAIIRLSERLLVSSLIVNIFCAIYMLQLNIEAGLEFNELNRNTSQVENDTSSPKEEAAKETKSAIKNLFFSVWQQYNKYVKQTTINKYLMFPEIELTETNDLFFW
ncbi:10035_t:CDS:2 [Racocetra persica]|uniref:10035_t:CDS:1 n=1 Tax=Racocetra persica TaxID=160502 RepID=A0ACA9KZD9_9GLOM|nr:10035_t:CDS:2 [Racocetra persica]